MPMPDAEKVPPYLIDKILPSKRVHLCAGISSAGKSRWLLPTFIMWNAGLPVLGLESHPVPWCVVCGDRPIQDLHDTLNSMGFDKDDVALVPAFGSSNRPRYSIMDEIKAIGAKFVLWEGFDMQVRNPVNPFESKEMLSAVTAYCEEFGVTVLGTVGVAKLKPHEMYQNPRQLVSGHTIWERATSTNFIVVPTNPRDIGDGGRLLYACLKNAPSFAVKGKFDESGMLNFDEWEKRARGSALAALVAQSQGKINGTH